MPGSIDAGGSGPADPHLSTGATVSSSRSLFSLVLVLGLLVLAARPFADPDAWWHLRNGQHIIENQTIPRTDIYSYTAKGHPWIAHEWLCDVLMFLTYRYTGLAGLTLTFSAVGTTAFLLAYRRSNGRPYVAGLAVLFGSAACLPYLGARPQMFTLLLASLFLNILEGWVRQPGSKMIWVLPPLSLIWANLHGGFLLGLALVAYTMLACILERVHSEYPAGLGRSSLETLRHVRPLCLVLLSSSVLTSLNPNGWRMYLYPLQTLASSSMQAYIHEWSSPDFHLLEGKLFAAVLLTSYVLLALAPVVCCRHLTLLTMAAYLALQSSRNVPLFCIVAIPVLADCATNLIRRRRRQHWLACEASSGGDSRPIMNALIALSMVAACALCLWQKARAQRDTVREQFPAAALDYMQSHKLQGPLFNAYEWGGYLIWRLYPEYPVFIDGRADVYGDRFLKEFVDVYYGRSDWQPLFKRHRIRTVLIHPDCPLAISLRKAAEFTVVFADSDTVVLTATEHPDGDMGLALRRLQQEHRADRSGQIRREDPHLGKL